LNHHLNTKAARTKAVMSAKATYMAVPFLSSRAVEDNCSHGKYLRRGRTCQLQGILQNHRRLRGHNSRLSAPWNFKKLRLSRVAGDKAIRYFLSVFGTPTSISIWTTPGAYDTPEEALDSFSPDLRKDLRVALLHDLKSGIAVRFSLENAFEGF
jgi:hypothetical protein